MDDRPFNYSSTLTFGQLRARQVKAAAIGNKAVRRWRRRLMLAVDALLLLGLARGNIDPLADAIVSCQLRNHVASVQDCARPPDVR